MSDHNHNPWHSISIGDQAPEIVRTIIEIPRGERAKYELDKESGMIYLDRILSSAVHYPTNYGFIPKTYCDDKDPLDILVICSAAILPNSLVDARVIGVMHMVDGGEQDDKIIAVANNDMFYQHIQELEDLPKHKLDEIKLFFQDYKKLEKKEVEVQSFEGKATAIKVVEDSIAMYQEEFK